MTPRSEVMHDEAERIKRTAGYYISPERLSALMGTAQKVISVLAGSRVPLSYFECEIVLDIVRSAMDRIQGD